MSRIPRRNLSHVIVDDVLAAIARGELAVGDRLPSHQELAERYDVGHSVVRDAAQRLAAMGILDVRPGRGSTIVALEAEAVLTSGVLGALLADDALDDLFALRRVVETETARRAATTAAPHDLVELERIHDCFRAAIDAGDPVYQLDVDLHRAIAQASRRPVFVRVLDGLGDVLAATRIEASRYPGASERAAEEHAAVIAAIAAGDPDAAAAAMAAHLRTAEDTLIALRHPGSSDPARAAGPARAGGDA